MCHGSEPGLTFGKASDLSSDTGIEFCSGVPTAPGQAINARHRDQFAEQAVDHAKMFAPVRLAARL